MEAYQYLLTVEELRNAFLASLTGAARAGFEDATSEVYSEASAIIEETTDDIERYLNRKLIIREFTFRFVVGAEEAFENSWQYNDGIYNSDGDVLLSAYALQWPVVQILSADGDDTLAGSFELIPGSEPGFVLAIDGEDFDNCPRTVVCYAGYRRADQCVGGSGSGSGGSGGTDSGCTFDLQEELPDLTVETADIEVLPAKIRRVAKNIAMFRFRQAYRGNTGVFKTSTRIEGVTVESAAADPEYVDNQLDRLLNFRKVPGSTLGVVS